MQRDGRHGYHALNVAADCFVFNNLVGNSERQATTSTAADAEELRLIATVGFGVVPCLDLLVKRVRMGFGLGTHPFVRSHSVVEHSRHLVLRSQTVVDAHNDARRILRNDSADRVLRV